MLSLEFLLWLGGATLALPTSVFVIECLLALLPSARSPLSEVSSPGANPASRTGGPIAVVIPAHDEAAVIATTLTARLPEIDPKAGDRLVVVADNCTDDTATRARAAVASLGEAALVLERHDHKRRGKGHALAYAFDHLSSTSHAQPVVVVIIDADCTVSPFGISQLAQLAQRLDRPVQADYVLYAPLGADPRTAISQLAFIVRNRVRPRGLKRIGVPCHLMGSGMAFPWAALRKAPPYGSHLVEDLAMGIDLSLLGHPPYLCQEVRVESVLPIGKASALGQRKRWEHGHLQTLIQHVPRLLFSGVRHLRPSLILQGLDLAVPPLALLVVLLFAFLAAAAGAGTLLGTGDGPIRLALILVGSVAIAVFLAWARFARAHVPARALLSVAPYLFWKLPLYLAFFTGKREKTWVRTERDTDKNRRRP